MTGSKKMKYKSIIAALAICAVLLGCESKEPESLPPEMLGVWKTSAPKYVGCFFELTKDKVLFANEDDYWENIFINTILRIEITPRVKQSLYTVYYRGEGGNKYESPFTTTHRMAVRFGSRIRPLSSG